MSLDDLEIRKHTAPLRAELDRQKEKCAAMRKERDEMQGVLNVLMRERVEAREEAAACIDFLRNLSEWSCFWEEGFVGKEYASQAKKNGQQLRAFLDEANHGRKLIERLDALKKERDALLEWQLEVAEGTGYINRAEGQGGYDVAPAATIIAAWKRLECEADRGKLIEQRDEARAAVAELVGVLKDCMDSFYENGRAGHPTIQLQRRVHDTINEYEAKP